MLLQSCQAADLLVTDLKSTRHHILIDISDNIDTIVAMARNNEDILDMLKALSNDTRLDIMFWLSHPEESFKDLKVYHAKGLPDWGGVCVGSIQEKSGLSQSTISSYLKSMQKAGLLECKRHEKWTYYRINEESVKELRDVIGGWR